MDASRYRRLWIHVWVAWGLAVTPVLDIIRRHPEFSVAHDLDVGRLAGLLGALLVLLPAPWVIWAWRQRRSSRPLLPLAPLAFPLLLLGLSVGRRVGGAWLPAAVVLAVLGVLALYATRPGIRHYATWLVAIASIAPLQLISDPAVRRLAAGSAPVTRGVASETSPPIVVVLLDELPITTLLDDDGTLDRRRFPQLARLAERSHWFENVRSVDTSTVQAVSALVAGRKLGEAELAIARDLPENLFTLLAPHYRVHAIERVTRLCPLEINRLAVAGRTLGTLSFLTDVAVLALHVWTPRDWAELLPPIHAGWGGFTHDDSDSDSGRPAWWRLLLGTKPAPRMDRVGQFRAWIAAIDESPAGVLYFSHLLLPHRPWIYMPDGAVYRTDGRHETRTFLSPRWPEPPSIAAQAYQRHLLQAEFTDRLIGELLDRLDEVELFDRSLIVVAADHGMSFRPGELMRDLSDSNEEDVLRVPLVVKLPNQREGGRHREAGTTLDVLPTILDVAGLEPPPALEGHSLLSRTHRSTPPMGALDVVPSSGLAHRRAVFGTLETPADLFAFGPFAHWVGTRLDASTLEPNPDIRLELARDGWTVTRLPDSALVPAWVYGTIEGGPIEAGFGVAVTVDGIVAATGDCQRVDDRLRFSVLLPAEALPVGEHRIDVIVIDPMTDRGWLPESPARLASSHS